MKTLFKTFLLVITFLSLTTTSAQNEHQKENYFQMSPRLGYDFPTFDNNTPYIDYKGGLEVGLSLDYYWNWFGIGADFDYIKNKPESTYPTTNLFNAFSLPITTFNLNEDKITRIFYGIGPNFKHQNQQGNFVAELNTRAGLASIKGGRTLLTDAATNNLLNFQAGYDSKNVLSAKAQVRLTYFFNETFGVHAGAYYLRHFNVTEEFDSSIGASASYQPFTNNDGRNLVDQSGPIARSEPCDCDISSIGVFAGITIKLTKKAGCDVCGKDHFPHCCATCGCGVTVTAKDKFTGEILPNTDVVLTDLNGNIVQSSTTNSYGVVVFNDVVEDNYLIKGKLHNVALKDGTIAKDEFKNCKKEGTGIQKTIVYADENFILKGNVVECNSTEGIQGVTILLKDNINASQKNTLSGAEGNFIFHLKQASTFTLNGKKDGYYSNDVEVSTNSYNRNNTLFINLEMCVDPCGQAVKLDNINFDLDKADILPVSIPDLQRVVKLMLDNPTIKVEMSSHTDSQGSDDYNKQLSQRRADATVNYIASQGVSKNRLIARGAGESELKNTKCTNNIPCTDDEHRINRRTEFKVICF
ncbi:MAG: OmpA family protein [Lutibacter sp.]|nr:OmpA family protein [Lutibacter sp.]MBP9600583.1 OmpA family protein [Lutibacter sp.]